MNLQKPVREYCKNFLRRKIKQITCKITYHDTVLNSKV